MNKNFLFALIIIAALLLGFSVWSSRDTLSKKEVQKTYTIGLLYQGEGFEKVVNGFRDEMNASIAKYGSVQYVDQKVSGADQKDFDVAAQKLVDAKVDLIFAVALEPVLAAKKVTATNQIPVVLALGGSPVTVGAVENLQKTGNNLTGMTWLAWDLSGKRLELLKLIDPKIKNILVVGKKGGKPLAASLQFIEPVAEKLGVKIITKELKDFNNVDTEVFNLTHKDIDAVYYAPDPFVSRNIKRFVKHSVEQKIPSIFSDEFFAREGGLASYGGNYESSGKQASRIASKVLFQHQRPQDLGIENVEKIDFVLNLVTAKKMGLNIPLEVQDLAGSIIR